MYTLLIIYFIISIGFSFLCSILEAVLLSITPSYITTQVQAGTSLGATLKSFKEDIDRPLSAILTLNTIAHTVGAILVGVEAGNLFKGDPLDLGFMEISMESIIAGVMTLAILILSEIIPKTLGANYWKQLTPFTVRTLKLLLWILAPLVWVSQLITKNLKTEKDKSVFSRADFRAMTQAGEESGALKSDESLTIRNLLRLESIKTSSIMTPRNVLLSADEGETLRSFYDEHAPLKNSRIPLFDSEKVHVVGILLKHDLLQGLLDGKDNEPLSTLVRPAIHINQNSNLSVLQRELISSKNHMAIVVDDFGAVLGIVTMEDLFETILGLEIVDETDDVADLQTVAREVWKESQGK